MSPNYFEGRELDGVQYRPEAVVLHITQGSLQSALRWFEDRKSQVSAHWIVDTEGSWHQIVPEEHTAWHAGRVVNPLWKGLKYKPLGAKTEAIHYFEQGAGEKGNPYIEVPSRVLGGSSVIVNPNYYTIGVEVVNFGNVPKLAQWRSWVRGIRDICHRWSIPMTERGLPNHFEIRSTKSCPRLYFSRNILKILNTVL